MPTHQLNKNVGIGGMDVGLVLIQSAANDPTQIATNEFGLKEVTLRFATFAANNPGLEPPRGTSCSDFIAGDTGTQNWLNSHAYLSCQTAKWIENGAGDGIDVLEVLCQGAVFDESGFTPPFFSADLVKDTLEFVVYEPIGGALPAFVATDTLPAYTHGTYLGSDGIQANANGVIPRLDGVSVGIGCLVLVVDGTAFAGLYVVADPGTPSSPWIMLRVSEMDASSEVNNTVQVNVAYGFSNAGRWHCTVSGSFTLNTTPITFENLSTTVTPQWTPKYKVTVDYHAVELNFQYVSDLFHADPRFIQDDYVLSHNDAIIIDRTLGGAVHCRRYSVVALEQTAVTSGSSVSVTDGPFVYFGVDGTQFGQTLSRSTSFVDNWMSFLRFVGVPSEFNQVVAGSDWSTQETTTIKMIQITPKGEVVAPS